MKYLLRIEVNQKFIVCSQMSSNVINEWSMRTCLSSASCDHSPRSTSSSGN